jgi:dGTPase
MAVDASRNRAPYACDPRTSRGRAHAEPEAPERNVFRRDCDRIIHSAAFRRLKHKTQVFVVHEGDHYRTRLTHTLEVTQIARSLARALGLDEDLAEAIALGHDLGHPPFGHAGEDALDKCLHDFGGFDHNAQTLRVVTRLERRYAQFDGLNLTWETLEGLIKHNGPFPTDAPEPIISFARGNGIATDAFGSAEAQAAAIADDIAYDAHDLDDGLRAELFGVDDLKSVPILREVISEVDAAHPALDQTRRVAEIIRRLIARLVRDVIGASEKRLGQLAPTSPDDVRRAGAAMVKFSDGISAADRDIKAFLFPHMYRHSRVQRVNMVAQDVVRRLYAHYTAAPANMPPDWSGGLNAGESAALARRAGDFIAGMTDRFALAEHKRIFDTAPELR